MSFNLINFGLSDYSEDDSKLIELAQSSLETFEKFASAAQGKIGVSQQDSDYSNAFASKGDASYGAESQRKAQSATNREYQKLTEEPVIARIIVREIATDEEHVYYVCRNYTPPTSAQNVISYRSPMGRLAALEIGETYDWGEETSLSKYDEKDITIIQRVNYTHFKKNPWDSKAKFYDTFSACSIASLLKLLQGPNDDTDFLSQFLEDDSIQQCIEQDIQRDIIESFSLRDQPILDKYQDEVFRLPLNSSLMLVGTAGSGKTTTLIHRLGLKLDKERGLSHEERQLVNKWFDSNNYETSWYMFTPTNLLKSYVKEAFNREGVPAPDSNITTWREYSDKIARDSFKILHTQKVKSGFIHDENALTLKDGVSNLIPLYSDFYGWITQHYVKNAVQNLQDRKCSKRLEQSDTLRNIDIFAQEHLKKNRGITSFITRILKDKDALSDLYRTIEKDIDTLIKTEANAQLYKDERFLGDFYKIVKNNSSITDENNEQEDIIELFDEEVPSQNEKRKAYNEYRKLLVHLARKKNTPTRKGKPTKNSILLDWLGDRKPSEATLENLRHLYDEINVINKVTNPVKNFIKSINKEYKNFRKLRQSENTWYDVDSALQTKINTMELDILILTHLMFSRDLLLSADIYQNTSDSWLSALEPVQKLYVCQILVDEAPDFSPIQLACMRMLSHPQVNSFFACGDFNQRLTLAGSQNLEAINALFPRQNLKIHEISRRYRQSLQLQEFSLKILKAVNGEEIEGALESFPTEFKGKPPVLGEYLQKQELIDWIAKRIEEIERILDVIPSIAILVPSEDFVGPVASELEKALVESSIRVQACYGGQAIGNENAVRVFDIKHIKGLEFETAFFVSIDRLEKQYPDLLAQYLYVGTTRAAMFLGMTYENSLPDIVAQLKEDFSTSWEN